MFAVVRVPGIGGAPVGGWLFRMAFGDAEAPRIVCLWWLKRNEGGRDGATAW